jgi:hypothetical protein
VSEDQNQPRGGVRRVGRKDQKKRLSAPDSLFPLEDFVDEETLAAEANELSLAREAAEEVEETRPHPTDENVGTERAAPLQESSEAGIMDFAPPSPEDEARFAPPMVTTPLEERFPPLAPKVKDESILEAAPETPRRGFMRQDAIALLFAFGTIGLCAYFTFVWFNPYSPLNPLAPPTPLPRVITATPQTSVSVPPTLTSDPNITATFTPFFDIVVTEEPTASIYPFVLAQGGVIYMPNANGDGCNWSSIAGTVTDTGGQPLNSYRIRVTSPTNTSLDESVFSGSTLTFGAGGFELPLGGAPQEAEFRVRLFDPAGAPISDEYVVTTRADCQANVAVVNFIEVQ